MALTSEKHDSAPFLSIAPLRYPREYWWLIAVSTLDLVMTWVIVALYDGDEANPIANLVLTTWGYWGLITYKFSLMVFVVVACEIIGRSRDKLARWLARFGVVISAVPFLVACYWLYLVRMFPL